jgi:hypothetical protein
MPTGSPTRDAVEASSPHLAAAWFACFGLLAELCNFIIAGRDVINWRKRTIIPCLCLRRFGVLCFSIMPLCLRNFAMFIIIWGQIRFLRRAPDVLCTLPPHDVF